MRWNWNSSKHKHSMTSCIKGERRHNSEAPGFILSHTGIPFRKRPQNDHKVKDLPLIHDFVNNSWNLGRYRFSFKANDIEWEIIHAQVSLTLQHLINQLEMNSSVIGYRME